LREGEEGESQLISVCLQGWRWVLSETQFISNSRWLQNHSIHLGTC